MADGFVVLPSYVEAIRLLPEERRWPFFEELFRYRMDGTEPEIQSDLERMALTVIFPIVDASVERYEKNKENGEKGGRPRKWIPPEEWQAYRKEHTQQETAEHFGISVRTLQNWEQAAKTGKNQNLNKNKNSNINSHKNIDISNSKEKNAGTPEGLKGPPAPRSNIQAGLPGYEWVRDGVRYRITENSEVEELGPV